MSPAECIGLLTQFYAYCDDELQRRALSYALLLVEREAPDTDLDSHVSETSFELGVQVERERILDLFDSTTEAIDMFRDAIEKGVEP